MKLWIWAIATHSCFSDLQVTEKNDKLQEKVEELEAEAEKLRRTNKMFEGKEFRIVAYF